MFELSGDEIRLRDHKPEPANLWIRHSLCIRGVEGIAWTNLATLDLGGAPTERRTKGRLRTPVDVVYVPPPGAGSLGEASVAIERCSRSGIPTLVQTIVGDAHPLPVSHDGTLIVHDLASVLIQERLDILAELDRGATVVWPVIAGLTDEPDLVAAGLEGLRAAGVRRVLPMALDLAPSAGRSLIEQYGDRLFDSVFHTREADLRGVIRACAANGLEFLPQRPQLPSSREFERQLAAELGQIGEILLALGDSPAGGQEFFRAAHWVEDTRHDVRALARDGNLGVVPWLSAGPRAVIEELGSGRRHSTLLEQHAERLVR